MKNIALILVGLVALGLVGYRAYSAMNQAKAPTEDTAMMDKTGDEQMMVDDKKMEDGETMRPEERYMAFTPDSFDQTAGTRRVLFFFANWCPTCIPVDRNLSDNADKIPEDVTVLRVNYNDTQTDQTEKDLAEKYEVTYQHTFVQINGNGEVVTRWNGGQLDELLKNII